MSLFDVRRWGQRAGRVYFAVQAVAGALWWLGVATLPWLREATLGSMDPAVLVWLDLPLFVCASALVSLGLRWTVWIIAPWTLIITAITVAFATITERGGWGALVMIAASAGTVVAGLLVWLRRLPTEWIISGPFAFRLSRGTSVRSHVLATALQLTLFWGFFLCAIPAVILWTEKRWQLHIPFPVWVQIVGAILLIFASALGLWSAFAFATRGDGTPLPMATAKTLVVSGPYRLVRNPMATAGIAQGVAVGMIFGSWLVVVYAFSGAIIWNWLVRPHEEADLEDRFGDEFRAYRDTTWCWVPKWVALSSFSNSR